MEGHWQMQHAGGQYLHILCSCAALMQIVMHRGLMHCCQCLGKDRPTIGSAVRGPPDRVYGGCMQRAPSGSPSNRRRQCSPSPDLAITRPSILLSSVLQDLHCKVSNIAPKRSKTLMQTA
jgi:hypothetical protein